MGNSRRLYTEAEIAIIDYLNGQGLHASRIAPRLDPPTRASNVLHLMRTVGIREEAQPKGRPNAATRAEQDILEAKIFGKTQGMTIFEEDLAVQLIELLAARLGYNVVITKRDGQQKPPA